MNLIKIDFLNFDNLKNKCECPIVFGEYINLYDTTFILIINNI